MSNHTDFSVLCFWISFIVYGFRSSFLSACGASFVAWKGRAVGGGGWRLEVTGRKAHGGMRCLFGTHHFGVAKKLLDDFQFKRPLKLILLTFSSHTNGNYSFNNSIK